MRGHLLLTNCIEDEVTRPNIELALKENRLLWLDLQDTGDETLGERYVRDLYDHLIRISDMVDSYRDLLSGSLEAYMSMVSNRLNDVMKQLTIIATVFLPLSFLTGFFGQNFAWLVVRMGSLGAFLGLGIGTEVLAVVALLTMFRRRGWMGRGNRS